MKENRWKRRLAAAYMERDNMKTGDRHVPAIH